MTQPRSIRPDERSRDSYSACLVAHSPGGQRVTLGAHRTDSPRLALRWLRGRTQDVADQCDPPYARPMYAWLVDTAEHARALDLVTAGEPYAFHVTDGDGTRYVFTAEPAETRRSAGSVEPGAVPLSFLSSPSPALRPAGKPCFVV